LLRKDFIFDPLQVLESKAFGADAVLLIVRALEQRILEELISYAKELGMSALVEVFDLKEAERALKAGAHIIGINNRDLETLKIDLNLSRTLVPKLKELGAKFVVVESGIETREQVLEFENLGADAFLIGTSLMKSQDPVKKLRELQGFKVSLNL
jgi:indole-3-glycerol phosphate synthase